MDDGVTHLRASALRGERFGPSGGVRAPRRARRIARRFVLVQVWIVVGLAALAGLTYLRLDSAPIRLEGFSERIATGLEARLGERWRVGLAETELTLHEGVPALAVDGVDLRNEQGELVLHAPRAVVSVGLLSALTANPTPRAVSLTGVELRLLVADDGSVSLLPREGGVPVPVAEVPDEDTPFDPLLLLGGAVSAALDRAGPLGSFDGARLADARLVLVDETGRERVGLSDVDMRLWTTRDGRRFEATVEHPGGTWSAAGRVAREGGGVRAVSLAVDGLPLGDLTLLAGISRSLGSDDITLTGEIDLALAADGTLARLEGAIATDAGTLRTRDPFMPFVPIETVAASVRWEPEAGRLAIEDVVLAGGRTRVALDGALVPDFANGGWRLDLAGRDAVVRGATPEDEAFALERVSIAARRGADGVVVDAVEIEGPGVDLAMTLSFGGIEDRGGLRVGLRTADMPVRKALALWPDFVAPVPRLFLRRAMGAGTVSDLDVAVALSGEDLAGLFDDRSLPDEAVAVSFAIDDARLVLDEAFPPLRGLDVTGFVSGRDARVEASRAHIVLPDGRRLDAREGAFRLVDFWNREARAEVALSATGGLDGLASFLRLPALAGAADLSLDPETVSGDVSLDVTFDFPINRPVVVADLPISAQGRLENVSADVMGGLARLENGTLALGFAPDGTLSLSGTGRIADNDVAVSLVQPRGGAGTVGVEARLDAAFLVSRGLVPENTLAGRLDATVAATVGPGDAFAATLGVDLANARVDGLLPGWTKDVGAPGRFAVTLASHEDGIAFSDLALTAGPVDIAGSGRFDTRNELVVLDLPRLRLSPGDDASLSVTREDGLLRARVRGNVLDARPFVSALRGSGDGEGETREVPKIDGVLDLEVAILGGFNDEIVTNADIAARITDGEPTRLTFEGRFPGAPLTASIADGRLRVETGNAGALLRFVDVYDKMLDGRLVLDAGLGRARSSGTLILWEFTLRDEPALARLVSRQTPATQGGDGRFGLSGPTVNVNEALFTKAQVDFVRDGPVVTLADARMWGAQVGFTAEGWLDLETRRLDVAGSFVPAYGLNNAFAQVPVFGLLLGGSEYEGLFAVNFRASGAMAQPDLAINPLSAIAPGVLRRLFGTGAPTRSGATFEPPPPAPPLNISPDR